MLQQVREPITKENFTLLKGNNTMVIYENKDYVVLATFKSSNKKTGDMAQIWILAKTFNPVKTSQLGLDSLICGNCKHRRSLGGACYVNLGQAPLSVWKAWKAGKYPKFDLKAFEGKEVRFGAYGDPALIPYKLVKSIANVAKKWTGYTHQWDQDIDPRLAQFFMASVDNVEEYHKAKYYGWRTFRVTKDSEAQKNEMLCLSESHDIQCKTCGLCNGNKAGKDIFIPAHGSLKNKVVA